MGKRRRERDRPKTPHDAPYNTSKRVLLSYGSDDEDEDQVPAWTPDTAPPAFGPIIPPPVTPAKQISNGIEVKQHDQKAESSSKICLEQTGDLDRQHVAYENSRVGNTKDHVNSKESRSKALRDIATGQVPALGSSAHQWDEDGGSEVYDSEEAEAMAYLRAVRSEREGMPTVFTAQIDTEDADDSRGFFDDHAYVAMPTVGPVFPPGLRNTLEPQDVFTESLKRRFNGHRQVVQAAPTLDALQALTGNEPISFPKDSIQAHAEWRRILVDCPPVLAQIQSLRQATVHTLLAHITKHHLKPEETVASNTGAWIWSLLARLDDVGTMINDDVFVVRELATQALIVSLSLKDPTVARQLETVREEAAKADDGDVRPHKALNHDGERPAVAALSVDELERTLATLDMIITVVGDAFGQRDLLEFRPAWQFDTGDGC